MALIAEYETGSSLLRDTLESAPDVTLELDTAYYDPSARLHAAFWAHGDRLGAFETGVAADDVVADVDRLSVLDDRRLYEVTFDQPAEDCMYPWMVERGIHLLTYTHSLDRTRCRVRCASRDVYRNLARRCEHVHGFCTTHLIVPETNAGGPVQVLTPKQREALCLGHERGYFTIPRGVDLADLADELAVSDTAVSQRIRRGIQQLLDDLCPP